MFPTPRPKFTGKPIPPRVIPAGRLYDVAGRPSVSIEPRTAQQIVIFGPAETARRKKLCLAEI